MLLKILTALVILPFFFVITAVGLRTPTGNFISSVIGHIPLGDKSLHFLLLLAMTFLVNASMRQRRVNLIGMNLLTGSFLVGFGITIEEFSQEFIPSRNFEIIDMMCNYAGIYAGGRIHIITTPAAHKHSENASHNRETIPV